MVRRSSHSPGEKDSDQQAVCCGNPGAVYHGDCDADGGHTPRVGEGEGVVVGTSSGQREVVLPSPLRGLGQLRLLHWLKNTQVVI